MGETGHGGRLLAVVARLKACAGPTAASVTRLTEAVTRIRAATARRLDSETLPLRHIAAQIRAAALADFESTELPRFRRLHEALSGRGVPLAALSLCGHGTAEVRYTQLLRYFLDPRSPHGLGTKVLQAVLAPELEQDGIPLDGLRLDGARVEAEVGLGQVRHGGRVQGCTLDLLVTLNDYHVLIEHKITSPEAGSVAKNEYSQLERYSKAAESNRERGIRPKRSLCLFLTPERKSPKASSQWRPLSHGDLVSRCVRMLSLSPEMPPVARHNLCCFLWDLLTGPAWHEEGVQEKLRRQLRSVLEDHGRLFTMKRWCSSRGVDWTVALDIVEMCNG
jgi:hypothetical protein